ncbi:hypothetical protein [Gimesia maris]|uniref:hypothetical protein n=1 Tax=Gimesia maris TaxID=122 RepID=UPI0030DA4F18|tara:strand:+ start:11351 stop:12814 length:1464 start_codon:yes stop_codon:yes gene_type:complete
MKTTLINAGPTKRFFVEMLTRDIELADAILDLLDNCVDGIVRDLKRKNEAITNRSPYQGYWAKIIVSPEKFEIWDNCGGIAEDIAQKSAFMLGRPDLNRDDDIETVGMYGIGMKRAMFKMGKHSVVVSHPVDEEPYRVEIPPEWLVDEEKDDDSKNQSDPWKLVLTETKKGLDECGTRITVTQLYGGIARQFNEDETAFIAELIEEISRHYALIIEKGFTVSVNGNKIKPVSLTLLTPQEVGSGETAAIEPYVFVGDFDGVHVDLAVGFYRALVTENELEDEAKVSRSREYAGWTVICNDRVVLYNDKTHKTGWNTKGITPGYHNQFISISGVVVFRSNHSMKLPLNTTKRGLDRDSEIYQLVLDYMREGLKKFTSFTNHWKKREEETQEAFRKLAPRKTTEISSSVRAEKLSNVAKVKGIGTAKRYSPELPKPQATQKQLRICFVADKADIELVADHYFSDRQTERSEVGKRCFQEAVEKAREGEA